MKNGTNYACTSGYEILSKTFEIFVISVLSVPLWPMMHG